MVQAGLVLEGGGMKGIYTAGVLEYFLEQELEFSSIYAVSAGACHMCSYISKQKERAKDVGIDYLDNKNYCSFRSLLLTGDLFNVDMCYNLIPNYLNPIDRETFMNYEGAAYSVVTNIVTGKPEYLRIKDPEKDIDAVRASASLPLVSRNVKINGKLYLDGGISDAIPIRKSIMDGNTKNVVVLTKEEGYVRKPVGSGQIALLKARYVRYPKIAELMEKRHKAYNDTMDYLYRLEESGKVFIIRPKKASSVGRIEKNKEKMEALYREGYEDAKSCFEQLKNYLNKD